MGTVNLPDLTVSQRTRELMASTLVWDDHGCMPLRAGDTEYLPQLQRYRDAGFDVCSLNVGFDVTPWENALAMLATFRHWIKQRSNDYLLVDSVDDIATARKEGKLAVYFDLEGACAINDQLSMIELYYDLGVRWMLFAYNKNNSVASGCEGEDTGLTDFGREVLREMERVGMIVCCSHVSHRSAMDIMEMTRNPVIFSHSNPRALRDHPRNITDEAIKACAKTGGVIAINGIGPFLGDNDNRTETFARHIDYVAQLVGTEHVGLGMDYVFDQEEMNAFFRDNPDTFPPEQYARGCSLVQPEQLPETVETLLKMGYSEQDLRNILGENHLRVARQVWK